MSKPRLLFFFNGLPEYEALYNIALRLSQRGVIEPVCFSPSEAIRREPRLKSMIESSGLNFTIRPSRWLKWFTKRWLTRGDAAVTLCDPTMDISSSRRRSQEMLKMKMPTIYIQHGVLQARLNMSTAKINTHFESKILLLFEEPLIPEVLTQETREKIEVVGFIKPVLFPPRAPKSALPDLKTKVLFCHSFRWAGRYGEDDVARFHDMVATFASRHPDHLIIVRSHRGKLRDIYKRQERALAKLPNIVFSRAHSGPLKGMSMTDVLAIADICISTASTAVLDSIYFGIPTAIYENDQPVFRNLPNIDGIQSLERFIANPKMADIASVRSHYGEVSDNIEKCCFYIEKTLKE